MLNVRLLLLCSWYVFFVFLVDCTSPAGAAFLLTTGTAVLASSIVAAIADTDRHNLKMLLFMPLYYTPVTSKYSNPLGP